MAISFVEAGADLDSIDFEERALSELSMMFVGVEFEIVMTYRNKSTGFVTVEVRNRAGSQIRAIASSYDITFIPTEKGSWRTEVSPVSRYTKVTEGGVELQGVARDNVVNILSGRIKA